MTIEFIFAVVQVVVTELVAVIFKDSVIPSRFIPVVNLVVGIIVAICSVCMGLYNDMLVAVLVSLGLAFAVGGAYDTVKPAVKALLDKEN